jgi:exodeoxyribonuclease V alpha subunit
MTSPRPDSTMPATVLACPPAVDHLARAGVLDLTAIHVADRICALTGPVPDHEQLALALAVRAPGRGHVAIDLATVEDLLTLAELADLPPDVHDVVAAALAEMVAHVRGGPGTWGPTTLLREAAVPRPQSGDIRPLVVAGNLVYLDRWYELETDVVTGLALRVRTAVAPPLGTAAASAAPAPRVPADDAGTSRPDTAGVERALDAVLAADQVPQRTAARETLRRRLVVVAGGPGTGKTWTIARILAVQALVAGPDRLPTVALAAPTGKAAARLSEGIAEALEGSDLPGEVAAGVRQMVGDAGQTLHRLLGLQPGRRPWRHADNPLEHDLVIVDEASMVALPLMAQLLDALAPSTRLVLVGDPDQLASVEAGTVLGDVVGALSDVAHPAVVTLQRVHRFREGSGIATLATAVGDGDVDAALATLATADDLTWLHGDAGRSAVQDAIVTRGGALRIAAAAGDVEGALAALGSSVVLAPHHLGHWGITTLNADAESWLAAADPQWRPWDHQQVGRPVLVTANDRLLGVHNGDLGVHVRGPDGDVRVVFDIRDDQGRPLLLHPHRLPDHDLVHAMTIHKSQGSQWRHVVVVLPERVSPLLHRELLYTAVTRAREHVTVVATPDILATAITTPLHRASGLRHRLVTELG